MENRRLETAPVWLVALAAAALGMSWAVTRQWSAPQERAEADQPSRTTAPLRWPLAELRPLRRAELSAIQTTTAPTLLGEAPVVRVDPPTFEPLFGYDLVRSVSAAPLATAPLGLQAAEALTPTAETAPAGYANRVIVLVPAAPQWRAGDGGRYVVGVGVRRDWSLGSLDTIAAARSLGRAIARPVEAAQPLFRVAQARLFGEPLRGPLVADRIKPKPTIAAVAPRLAGPLRPPVTRPVAVTPRTVAAAPTIVSYLDRADLGGAFPVPMSLGDQLDRVAAEPGHAPWSWAVAYRLRTLAGARVDDLSAHRTLRTLSEAADEAFALAEQSGDAPEATELRRAGYALTRRLAMWRAEQAQTIAAMQRPGGIDPLAGARWAMSQRGLGLAPGMMLADIERVEAQPVRLRVARRIEQYEQAPSTRLAQLLATDAARLGAEADAESRAVGQALDGAYRNANVRVAIAAELVERMVPQPEPVTSPIRDRIAGTPITGRSTTETALSVQLVEDPSAWRIGLEARGMVVSQTYSHGGPATLGARGATSFLAKKLVVLTPEGLQAAPSVADVHTESQRLVSLSTDYDRVPLVGNYVRSAARTEYGRVRRRAQAETQVKVERQVIKTLDERVTPRLVDAELRFADEVVGRASSLGLTIEPLELRTTDRRLISRLRVANGAQLAAHTPRMRAPSDSWLSVQLHESTFNNALEGLGLAGETMTPAELRERIVTRLRLPERQAEPAEDAVLRFAATDPVRIEFADGRAHLTLSFAEIAVRGRRHADFKVHAFYRPEVHGLTAELVQDGAPHIEGRMRNASRMHLHGVMGKVLGENRRLAVVRLTADSPERLSAALVGLATNQLVIEDGWLGLAIGPERVTNRVAVQVGGYVR
ncbi:hypothetical protein Pla108_34020 [Botrimarina colliarenosi]|uniref:Uncharacterized protein n=1 Tax=Botrimarina colliarenosi TaxID=2528001 RepID=A0A5C6A7I5_9BACT|nr:hypothetical protein [Botrimarina colliarenosi]TWT95258.1 hypothetical protein Pla108_34020 [Botrimarina colliarenosi]